MEIHSRREQASIRVGSRRVIHACPTNSPLMVAGQIEPWPSLYPQRDRPGLGRAPGTDQENGLPRPCDRRKNGNLSRNFLQDLEELAKNFFLTKNLDAGQGLSGQRA